VKKRILAAALVLALSLSALTVSADYAAHFDEMPDRLRPSAEINLNLEEGRQTYRFRAREAGLYALEAQYELRGGSLSDTVEVSVLLNGEQTLTLPRLRAGGEILSDDRGNHLLPRSAPYTGRITAPFKTGGELIYFDLEAGWHELTFTYDSTAAVFFSLTFKNFPEPPPYEKITPTREQIEATPAFETPNEIGSNTIFLQAEKPLYKTHAALRPTRDSVSCNVVPSGATRRLYNTLGGNGTWSGAGQAVSYGLVIPNDGYYRFSVKARQNLHNNAPSHRRLLINGAVPCSEMDAIAFPYSPDWYRQDITDAENRGIFIFLEAGIYTLTLEAVGEYSPLELDYIEIATAHESFARVKHDLYDQLVFSFGQFMNSFFNDDFAAKHSADKLTVWVCADDETILLLRDFLGADYIVSRPPGAVLEAALAGNKPDIALYLSESELEALAKRGFLNGFSEVGAVFKSAKRGTAEFFEWFSSEETQHLLKHEKFSVKGASELE
jgi:hypothetical protein